MTETLVGTNQVRYTVQIRSPHGKYRSVLTTESEDRALLIYSGYLTHSGHAKRILATIDGNTSVFRRLTT